MRVEAVHDVRLAEPIAARRADGPRLARCFSSRPPRNVRSAWVRIDALPVCISSNESMLRMMLSCSACPFER